MYPIFIRFIYKLIPSLNPQIPSLKLDPASLGGVRQARWAANEHHGLSRLENTRIGSVEAANHAISLGFRKNVYCKVMKSWKKIVLLIGYVWICCGFT